MNRLVICLTVLISSGIAANASAGHGRRIVRVHHVGHAHVVHRVPVVHHVPVVQRSVVRVAPSHHHHVPHVYHPPVHVYPAYGHATIRTYSYPARIYVASPVISLRFGF